MARISMEAKTGWPMTPRSRSVLAARTEDQLREVAAQVEAAGRRAVVVPGDLTDFELMASLAETARRELGRLDIVVNNMGGTMPRPLLDTSPRFLEEAFRFNVTSGHALLRDRNSIGLADAPGLGRGQRLESRGPRAIQDLTYGALVVCHLAFLECCARISRPPQITFFVRSAAISAAPYPSSARTSSVCSPRSGERATSVVLSLSLMGFPTVRYLPRLG